MMSILPNTGILGDDRLDALRAEAIKASIDAPVPQAVADYVKAMDHEYIAHERERKDRALDEIGLVVANGAPTVPDFKRGWNDQTNYFRNTFSKPVGAGDGYTEVVPDPNPVRRGDIEASGDPPCVCIRKGPAGVTVSAVGYCPCFPGKKARVDAWIARVNGALS